MSCGPLAHVPFFIFVIFVYDTINIYEQVRRWLLPRAEGSALSLDHQAPAGRGRARGLRAGGQHGAVGRDRSKKDTKLAQKLGQLQPFIAVVLLKCMGQLASSGPT
jgi:hypothetical protein